GRHASIDRKVLVCLAFAIPPCKPGSVWDNGATSICTSSPIQYYLDGAAPCVCPRRGMPTRRIRCNVNASDDRYFPRVLRDNRLRNRRDAGREHIPLRWRDHRLPAGKWRNTDRSISYFRCGVARDGGITDNSL